jgi:hypothetical protein
VLDVSKLVRIGGLEQWIAGIERGGCCLSITPRDYARLGLFMDEAAQAGVVDVLA